METEIDYAFWIFAIVVLAIFYTIMYIKINHF